MLVIYDMLKRVETEQLANLEQLASIEEQTKWGGVACEYLYGTLHKKIANVSRGVHNISRVPAIAKGSRTVRERYFAMFVKPPRAFTMSYTYVHVYAGVCGLHGRLHDVLFTSHV